MTYRISKTVLDRCNIGDFAARSATHAVEMKAWRAHMARVKDDEEKDVPAIDRHMPFPRPIEHELVEAAVNENDEMDYEIVYDGPTPDQMLREKKDRLLAEVSRAEQVALDAIIPVGKRRLLNMQRSDIEAADRVRAAKINEKRAKLLTKASTAIGISDPIDLETELAKARPAEDTEFLERHSERGRRSESIQRAAAQVYHDIEDLTLDNIDDWKAPDFKEQKE